MRTTELAHKVADLVDEGWEYPEAEWKVLQNISNPPSGPEMIEMYDAIQEDRN